MYPELTWEPTAKDWIPLLSVLQLPITILGYPYLLFIGPVIFIASLQGKQKAQTQFPKP